jgi:hypothetical protein
MPYSRIPTNHIADRDTRKLFERADAFLADVYTMLSSRPLKRTNAGGCNLTATLVLLCIVDAIATHVYPRVPIDGKKNAQKRRFTRLLRDRLPWQPERFGWVNKSAAAEMLYLEHRNTLTHALGTDRPSKHRGAGFVEPTAGIWGDIQPQRIGNVDARKRWPKEWPVLSVLTDTKGTRHKITVAALYWAVKRMVADLAAAS